ncbi:MAG TPA: acyltransferase [Jiangellaceae bacterium]|nr:acyltransferase [Jiangellaceae bacterium]
MRLLDAARATPVGRDRVIDFVRTASLAAVILGHWLMASVTVTEAGIRGRNALTDLPWLQPLTWLLQVMPLFFVAGGFANLVSWRGVLRGGGGYASYAYGRISRLMTPTLVFVTAVPIALLALPVIGLSAGEVAVAGDLLGRPLWFLGVYVLITALAPALAAWHDRQPVAALATLGAMAVGTDIVRFNGLTPVGYLNFGFVWLFAQQLGFWYADGRITRLSRGAFWACLAGSIGLLTILTGFGPYPLSMVGLPGEVSNMAPPTVCLLVLSAGQVAALMLVRSRLAAWLEQPRPWSAVVLVGSMAMTLYLWHLAVLVFGFGGLVWLDVPTPEPGTAAWWLTRPVWCALLGALLAAIAVWLARFERSDGSRRMCPANRGVVMAGVGTVVVSAGLFGVVFGGLVPSMSLVFSLAAVASGLTLTTRAANLPRQTYIH